MKWLVLFMALSGIRKPQNIQKMTFKEHVYKCSIRECDAKSASSFDFFKHLEDKHGLPFISTCISPWT